MRQIKTDTPLIEYNGSVEDLLQQLDLLWLGRKRKLPPRQDPWWQTSEPMETISERVKQLSSVAPDGYSFGGHPYQPTCLGFWPTY